MLALSAAVSAIATSHAATFVWAAGYVSPSTNWYGQNWFTDGLYKGTNPTIDDSVYLNHATDHVVVDPSFYDGSGTASAKFLTTQGQLEVTNGAFLFTRFDTTLTGYNAEIVAHGFNINNSSAYLNYDGGMLNVNGGRLEASSNGLVFTYAINTINQNQGFINSDGLGSTLSIGGFDLVTQTTIAADVTNRGANTIIGAGNGGLINATTHTTDNDNSGLIYAISEDSMTPGADSVLQWTATTFTNHNNAAVGAVFGGVVNLNVTNFYNYVSAGAGGLLASQGHDSLGHASQLNLTISSLLNDGSSLQSNTGGAIHGFIQQIQNSNGGLISSTDAGSVVDLSSLTIENISSSNISALAGGTLSLSATQGGSGLFTNDSSAIYTNAGNLSVRADTFVNQNNGQVGSGGGGSAQFQTGEFTNDASLLYATGDNSLTSVSNSDSFLNRNNSNVGAISGGTLNVHTSTLENDHSNFLSTGTNSLGSASEISLVATTGVVSKNGSSISATIGGNLDLTAPNLSSLLNSTILADHGTLNATISGLAVNDGATIRAANGGTLAIAAYSLDNSAAGLIDSDGLLSGVHLTGYSPAFSGAGSALYNAGTIRAENGGVVVGEYDTIVNDGALGNGQIVSSTFGLFNLNANAEITNEAAGLIESTSNSSGYLTSALISNASGSVIDSNGVGATLSAFATEFDNSNNSATTAVEGGTLHLLASTLINDTNSLIEADGNGSLLTLNGNSISNLNGAQIAASAGGKLSILPGELQLYNDATSKILAQGGSISAANYTTENAGLIQSDGLSSSITLNDTSTSGGSLDHGTFYNDPSGTLVVKNAGSLEIKAQQTFNYGAATVDGNGLLFLSGNVLNPSTSYVENNGSIISTNGGWAGLGVGADANGGDTVVNNGTIVINDRGLGTVHYQLGGGQTVNNGQIVAQGLYGQFIDYADRHVVGASGITAAINGGSVFLDEPFTDLGVDVVNYGVLLAQDNGAKGQNGYATSLVINATKGFGSTENHGFYGALAGGEVDDFSKTWSNAPEGRVVVDGSSSMTLNTGGGDLRSNWNRGSVQVSNGSTLTVTTGTNVSINSGQITIDPTSSATYYGSLVQSNVYDGQSGTIVDKGVLNAQVVQLGFGGDDGGTLTGNGKVVGTLSNISGLVKPGDATSLFVTMDYSQYSEGRLEMSIEGLAGLAVPGGNDVLSVGRNAYLDGSLNLDFAPGYMASVGDTFYLLLTGGAVNGAFASVNSFGLTHGYFAQAVYDPSDVRIQIAAVPEPTTLAAMGLGLLALARRRRK